MPGRGVEFILEKRAKEFFILCLDGTGVIFLTWEAAAYRPRILHCLSQV